MPRWSGTGSVKRPDVYPTRTKQDVVVVVMTLDNGKESVLQMSTAGTGRTWMSAPETCLCHKTASGRHTNCAWGPLTSRHYQNMKPSDLFDILETLYRHSCKWRCVSAVDLWSDRPKHILQPGVNWATASLTAKYPSAVLQRKNLLLLRRSNFFMQSHVTQKYGTKIPK